MSYSLYPGFDITPFLSRPSVPYVAPRAPDITNLLNSMDLGHGLISQQIARADKKDQQDREEKLRRDQLKQQADLEKSQQGVQMRGQDIMEGARQDTNNRLDRDKAEQFIRQALSSGNEGDVHALDLAARGLGWTREELPSNHQAGAEAAPAAQPQFASAAGPPQSFDAAYDAATKKESGGNPRAVNPQSGALGAFQLMPDQLPKGVSRDQFLAMTPEQQKGVFTNTYLPAHGLSKDTLAPQDVGLSIGAPSAIGKPDDFVVYPKGSSAVQQNPSWDRDRNGEITAKELRQNYGGGMPAAPMLTLPDQQIGPPTPQGPGSTAEAVKPGMRGQLETQPGKFDVGGYMQGAYDMAPLSQQQAAPAQGGGRHVFRDKDGNVVAEVDLPAIRARHMDSLGAALDPILTGAKTPAEKQAAEQARGFAVKAVDSGEYSWKEAANKAVDFYQRSVGEAGKTSRAGLGNDFRQLHASNQQADHILGQVARDSKLPAMNLAEQDLRGTIGALGTGSGTGDVIAIRKLLKAIEGRATDADYQSVINSSGWVNRFLNLPENVLEGRLTPEVIAQIKQNVEGQLQQISRDKATAAQKAADLMEQSLPYLGDDVQKQLAQRNYDYFYGNGSSRSGTPSKPSSSPSDDDLVKGMP